MEVEEELSTKVTQEDLENAIDEYGVKYSPDGKRLLKGEEMLWKYQVRPGTKVICDSAFEGCVYLQSITLPDSVTHIGDSAFSWCWNLESITLPDSVTHIGNNPFERSAFECSGIKEIISRSVHFKVQDSCLYNADGTHLITYFGREESVTLPDSVTHIGDRAFWECLSLQSITLPDSVTHIGDRAFWCCESLQSITLPDSVTHIGDRAFWCCNSLQSITLPDSVTHIGDSAFEYCESLQSITLPDSVTHIGGNPFKRSGIKEIISRSVHFKVQDSCLYNADGTHLISYFGEEKSVTLPDSVTHIGDSAFNGCDFLQSITLPDSVTHIGDRAFEGV